MVGNSQCQSGVELPKPQGVSVEADFGSRVLSVTWERDLNSVLSYDIEVLHTELMETVYNGTTEVRPDPTAKVHRWNWTSPIPLECTSHSVKVRSRHQQQTSEWSPLQTVLGMDIPENTKANMYPQDQVVPVGSELTFCCIVEEKKNFKSIWYRNEPMNHTRLSRRSYASTKTNQPSSISSGTNVFCFNDDNLSVGTVVFVGYPPHDRDLVCETRDLESVECQWNKGQDTSLRGPRRTIYTLNGSNCTDANQNKQPKYQCWLNVTLDKGERNWTLEAKNPLGTIQVTDTADLSLRVRPYAPLDVAKLEVHARNASVHWSWGQRGYKALPLLCQVQLVSSGHIVTRNYSGPGLSQAVMEGLQPDEVYVVRVRCGSQQNFWKWGDWSSDYIFRTEEDCPDALNIWIRLDTNQSGYVMWKPLSKSESHGQIKSYEVTLGSPGEEGAKIHLLSQDQRSAPFHLEGNDTEQVIVVRARNCTRWRIPPASITIPRFSADEVHASYEVLGRDGGFDLFWPADANSSCGYVVDWCPTSSGQNCSLDWVKVPTANTSARIQSKFVPGVRYTFSIYACTSGAPELLERREGYVEELAPLQQVSGLKAQQIGSGVLLSWNGIPLESQGGFIRGYIIYVSNSSHLIPIANITDPNARNHTVTHLSPSTYKFTVKAYTSAGQDGGNTISIKLDPFTDWLIVEILVSLGVMTCFLLIITSICYKKRKWVKKTFYPEIPEPKLPEDWPTTQGTFGGRTLDVVPCPHNPVHIVERVSGKPGLEVTPEDDEEQASSEDDGPVDTYSSGPVALRYYNLVVGDGSQGPPSTDTSSSSSTSSMGSTRTEVTYTGIQTCGISSEAPSHQEIPAGGGYRPQVDPASASTPTPALGPAEPVGDQADPADLPLLGTFGGYQPQCSWRMDSPEAGSLNSSLGSPTSVSSSQFLLPDPASEEGDDRAPSTTWFHSLLSGKP
ncbi:LOW QUALITY PROTEIN: LIF receptor subunit alpha a [Megalops cyprinoides]|uniref:LOW QUALITY PROTEIN: LIF receptor subunit alpha a n=1 Tax=Megalops cyprinoides TaxID=118141 RepID=UPI0018651A59|nr:LOW QUALITY PROTEIN: LIF receptor subunit alpha a [Megalops cyprinoides]